MIFVKTYASLPPPDREEICAYAGVRRRTADSDAMLEKALALCADVFQPRLCYALFPLTEEVSERALPTVGAIEKTSEITLPTVGAVEKTSERTLPIAGAVEKTSERALPTVGAVKKVHRLFLGTHPLPGQALSRHLQNCPKVILFTATVGLTIDRMIQRHFVTEPAIAVWLNAIGSERVEALCRLFCTELKADYAAEGLVPIERFSPGYGDLPLAFQKDIFTLLDCPRKIGVTLNQSLLMSPEKSVSALVGLRPTEQ